MDRTIVFYVGGGCDGYCSAETKIVQTYAQGRGPFYTHFQTAALKHDMLVAEEAGKPIVVIGHSWGGSAVINLMFDATVPRPNLLVSVDPVGKGPALALVSVTRSVVCG